MYGHIRPVLIAYLTILLHQGPDLEQQRIVFRFLSLPFLIEAMPGSISRHVMTLIIFSFVHIKTISSNEALAEGRLR